jgi:uncharacterized protein (TIGR00369 family)
MTSMPSEEFLSKVRATFDQQTLMRLLGARLEALSEGVAEIRMPYNPQMAQQNGYLHAGIVTTLVDTACGCAAISCSPEASNVLSVEFKVNFLAPARGDEFVASAKVLKVGKTLTICQGEVKAISSGAEPITVAVMLATMMLLRAK